MLTRREFLKLLGTGSALALFSPQSLFANINPLAIVELIDFSCVNCSFAGICIKWKHGVPKIGIKIKYWIPHGFMETGSAWEIGASSPAFGFIVSALTPLIKALMPFKIPTGSKTYTWVQGQEDYFKLYPHYFGFPNAVIEAIAQALAVVIAHNPFCICGVLEKIFMQVLGPVNSFVQNIYNKLEKFKKFAEKIEQFTYYLNLFPVFFSELVFPIWIIEEFNPDVHTIAPLFNSFIETITKTSPTMGAIVCPYLIDFAINHGIQFPAGIDPSFICVGHWGFGYPRFGIVRHDDPFVAGLLSIARFHHLFSTTLPIINVRYSNTTIKYQMYNPYQTSCFRPGYWTSDLTAKPLFNAGKQEIQEAFKNPLSIGAKIKSAIQNLNPIKHLPAPNRRNVGVVVWKHYSQCCF